MKKPRCWQCLQIWRRDRIVSRLVVQEQQLQLVLSRLEEMERNCPQLRECMNIYPSFMDDETPQRFLQYMHQLQRMRNLPPPLLSDHELLVYLHTRVMFEQRLQQVQERRAQLDLDGYLQP